MSDEVTLDALLLQMARYQLPWEQAWAADFRTFAERFTLHDSNWIGLFLDLSEGNEAILAVEWDGHWLPEPLRTECMEDSASPPAPDWPFLLMRIAALRAVQLSGYETPCSGRQISQAALSVEEGVNILEIADFLGGTACLEFTGRMQFLAFRRSDGRQLDLAKVDPCPNPPTEVKPWWKFW